MAPSVVNLLYGRGEFGTPAATQTTYCLWGYTLGLTSSGLSLILASAFYAKNQYRVTTLITFYCLILNILLNLLFGCVYKWGSFGIAVATSITGILQSVALAVKLVRDEDGLTLPKTRRAFFRVAGVCLISGVSFFYLQKGSSLLYFPRNFLVQVQLFSKELFYFLAALFGLAGIFRVKEIFALLEFIPKLKRK